MLMTGIFLLGPVLMMSMVIRFMGVMFNSQVQEVPGLTVTGWTGPMANLGVRKLWHASKIVPDKNYCFDD